jgi:hypothetical protein
MAWMAMGRPTAAMSATKSDLETGGRRLLFDTDWWDKAALVITG